MLPLCAYSLGLRQYKAPNFGERGKHRRAKLSCTFILAAKVLSWEFTTSVSRCTDFRALKHLSLLARACEQTRVNEAFTFATTEVYRAIILIAA